MRVLRPPRWTPLGETCHQMVTLKKHGPLHHSHLRQKRKKKEKGKKQKQSGVKGTRWEDIFRGIQPSIHLPFTVSRLLGLMMM